MSKDNLYDSPLTKVPSFTFGEKVVEVFDDMITRSVPLYQEVGQTTLALANEFAQTKSVIYDLGCSTGTTLLALGKLLGDESIKLVGIDASEAMLNECRQRIEQAGQEKRIEIHFKELLDFEFMQTSVAIANYTLQFLPVAQRQILCQRVANSMQPGGIFILSEKIRHPYAKLQNVLQNLHHDFKLANGYSQLEIAQKRQAIEDVLVPITIEENIDMLRSSGFDIVYPVLTWYTFVTLVGIKL